MSQTIIATIYRPDGSRAFGPMTFNGTPEHQVKQYCESLAAADGLTKYSVEYKKGAPTK